jgi:hypothetical protein
MEVHPSFICQSLSIAIKIKKFLDPGMTTRIIGLEKYL